jgi:hypothetical protein
MEQHHYHELAMICTPVELPAASCAVPSNRVKQHIDLGHQQGNQQQ